MELKVLTKRSQHPDLVPLLEDVLEQAKKGEIRSIALTRVTADGEFHNGVSYVYGDNLLLVAAVDFLKDFVKSRG